MIARPQHLAIKRTHLADRVEPVGHGRILTVPNGQSAAEDGADRAADHGQESRSSPGRAKIRLIGALILVCGGAITAARNWMIGTVACMIRVLPRSGRPSCVP